METTHDFGFKNKIKEYCNRAGISFAELAGKIGVQPPALTKWLNNPELKPANAKKIIETLISLDSLTTTQQAEELLQLACPDSPLFTEEDRERNWYKKLKNLPDIKPPNVLPAIPTPTIGREKEISECLGLLTDATDDEQGRRLLTITGTGGIGKTRTALELAHRLKTLAVYPDGVYFFALSHVNAGEQVLDALATGLRLGLTPSQTTGQINYLLHCLKDKHNLLVLDNLEHIAKDKFLIRLLNLLLTETLHTNILVTSRQPLMLEAEQVYRLPPLRLPLPTELLTPEQALEYSAIAFFVQRVKRVNHNFKITEKTLPEVISICRQMDGIPLALELAAAQLDNLGLGRLNSILDNQSAKSVIYAAKPLQSLPEHQESLDIAIERSYRLLGSEAQTLFCKLSIWPESFTLEAISNVCYCSESGMLPHEAFEALAALTNLNLVSLQPAKVRNEERYNLLETLKYFAGRTLQKVESRNSITSLQQAHADYYLQLAQRTAPTLNEKTTVDLLEAMSDDHVNFNMALQHYINANDTVKAYELVGALGVYWFHSRLYAEGVKWYEAVFAMTGSNTLPPMETYAECCHQAGRLNASLGNYAQATKYYETARKLWLELGHGYTKKLCLTLSGLGGLAYRQTKFSEAKSIYLDLQYYSERLGDSETFIQILAVSNLGHIAEHEGRYGDAKTLYSQWRDLATRLGNEASLAAALNDLAKIFKFEKDYPTAKMLYLKSFEIYRKLNHYLPMVMIALNMTKMDFDLKDFNAFIKRTLFSSKITRDYNFALFVPYCLLNFLVVFGIIIEDKKEAKTGSLVAKTLQVLAEMSPSFEAEDLELLELVKATTGNIEGTSELRDTGTSELAAFELPQNDKRAEAEIAPKINSWELLEEQLNYITSLQLD